MAAERPERDATPDELRTYFAGERTLLAWIRTALSMTGFGFLVARFGLFLRELASLKDIELPRSTGWSLWIGTALVLMGAVVNVFAAARHADFVRRFRSRELSRLRRSWFEIGLALALAVLGVLMAVYLVGLPR